MIECQACGYDELVPAGDGRDICPCCGFSPQVDRSPEDHRKWWIDHGCEWWSPVDLRPTNWDPREQLRKIGVVPDH
jgi:hypothetical protein